MLTEDYIKTMKPEEQEICNQLNRRTEFIVLRTTYGMFDQNGQKTSSSEPNNADNHP